MIRAADGLRQAIKLADTALDRLGVGHYAFDRALEHLRQPGFPAGHVGLGAGHGEGVCVHRYGKDPVTLGKPVGHQRDYRGHVDVQRVNAQIRLPCMPGQPLREGFQARAMGGDALQWMQGAVGRQRRYAPSDVGCNQPCLDQGRQ